MKILIDSIFSFSYNKGDVLPDISYNGYELLFLTSGNGSFIEGSKVSSYYDQDVFFATPDCIRTIRCNSYTQYICIRFHVIGTISDLSNGLYHTNSEEISNLFTSIWNEYKNKEYKYYEFSILKLQEIIIRLSRLLSVNTSSDLSIHKLIKEIDTTLNFHMTVQEMADSLNYTYDYFRHTFKNITGQSPNNYITNKRIQNACELLRENNHTCTTIAHLCGFSSSSQFSKLFKREIGISPNTYQKHLIKEAEEEKIQYLLHKISTR
ncbi:MAG: AraC family transcriptional regulator [Eubacteriales bacterium]